jgi:hypothetical protein
MELKTNYLPISTKRHICETIVNNSIIERDGMKFIDSIQKQIAFDLSLIQFYTDIDIENIDMDEMYQNGTIEEIKKLIPVSEISFIEEHVYYMLDQETEVFNSLSAIVNRNLQKLLEKIPDEKSIQKILKSVPNTLNKLSPESKEIFKGMIEGKLK